MSGLQFALLDDEEIVDDGFECFVERPTSSEHNYYDWDDFQENLGTDCNLRGVRAYFDTPLSLRSPRLSLPLDLDRNLPLLLPASPSSSYSSSPAGSYQALPLLALPPSQPFSSPRSSSKHASEMELTLIPEGERRKAAIS